MTEEEVLKLAHKAGILDSVEVLDNNLWDSNPWRQDLVRELTLFATLIEAKLKADQLAAAVLRGKRDTERQIAEALRQHGLTLVKVASGYEIIRLEQIAAVLRERESRKPLADERIFQMMIAHKSSRDWTYRQGARDAEAAHGITGCAA